MNTITYIDDRGRPTIESIPDYAVNEAKKYCQENKLRFCGFERGLERFPAISTFHAVGLVEEESTRWRKGDHVSFDVLRRFKVI